MESKLLVVDWDAFFATNEDGSQPDLGSPMLYDWGHREAPFFKTMIWPIRAMAFDRSGVARPQIDRKRVADFWGRVQIDRDARLWYADSNMWAAASEIREGNDYEGVDEVWLYDAHHDAGYGGTLEDLIEADRFDCGSWMAVYGGLDGAELHMRYPTWRQQAFSAEPTPIVPVDRQFDDGSVPPVVFDEVFVCRSSAWVPPWGGSDEAFLEFVRSCPTDGERMPFDDDETEPRQWDEAWVDQLLDVDRRALELADMTLEGGQ
jgi:hypothetical protein